MCEGTDSDGPGELERRQRHIDVPYRELSRGCVDDARIARIRRLRAAVWWRYNRCRYDIKPKGGAATGLPNKEANTAKVELDARENSSSGHAAAQASTRHQGRGGERSSGQTYVRGGQTFAPRPNVWPRGTNVWPKTVDTANMEAVISKSLLGLVVKVLDLKPDGKLKTNVGYKAGAK